MFRKMILMEGAGGTPAGAVPPPAGGTPTTPPAPPADDVKALRATVDEQAKQIKDLTGHLETVKKESIDRRKENTELRTFRDAFQKALGLDVNPDPAAAAAAAKSAADTAQEQMKGILIHSHAMALAAKAGARDAEVVARLLDTAGLEVDVAKRTVDAKSLTERIDALKKSSAYLFADAAPPPAPGATPPPAGTPTPTPPKPSAGGGEGGTPIEQYDRLMAAGKVSEAQQVYLKHRTEIGAALEARINAGVR